MVHQNLTLQFLFALKTKPKKIKLSQPLLHYNIMCVLVLKKKSDITFIEVHAYQKFHLRLQIPFFKCYYTFNLLEF